MGRRASSYSYPKLPPIREDLAWAAGFLDGEGSFVCRKSNQIGKTYYGMTVSVNQRHDRVDTLLRLESILGGRVGGPYQNNSKSRNSQPYSKWMVCSFEQSQAVIALVWNWLSEASKQKIEKTVAEIRTGEAERYGK